MIEILLRATRCGSRTVAYQGMCGERGASQRGQIMILTVLILALGAGFLVYSTARFHSIDFDKNAKTERAFAQVKQALMGWSASRTPTPSSLTIRPGELPCPDMNNDGLSNDGDCSAGAIGRVPWKTLGIRQTVIIHVWAGKLAGADG